jgi:hypothetical protein
MFFTIAQPSIDRSSFCSFVVVVVVRFVRTDLRRADIPVIMTLSTDIQGSTDRQTKNNLTKLREWSRSNFNNIQHDDEEGGGIDGKTTNSIVRFKNQR